MNTTGAIQDSGGKEVVIHFFTCRIAKSLSRHETELNDEELYQKARRIVIAEMQSQLHSQMEINQFLLIQRFWVVRHLELTE